MFAGPPPRTAPMMADDRTDLLAHAARLGTLADAIAFDIRRFVAAGDPELASILRRVANDLRRIDRAILRGKGLTLVQKRARRIPSDT